MGEQRSDHTPAELHDIADRIGEITEDARVTQARKTLAAARAAVDDYSTPYAPQVWAARLDVALETLLAYVAEAAPGGRLDEIANAVGDLAAGRDEELETLRVVKRTLDVKIAEAERLTAIEAGLDRLTAAIVGAVQAEMTDKQAEQ